ncbi:hypothetical protein [Sabulicella rubraurantiaca]|uniref:hypothetical protein n=1 Tax=Sabulicella rubraurantiaca TaxID=2811429 RepID=UPI001A95F07E|nr:hypothetical protein [Sabulicella rubraurantiaca]
MTNRPLLALALLALSACASHRDREGFIPFWNVAENRDLSRSPQLGVSFPGSQAPGAVIPFTMDTGSVGVVASADHFRPEPGARSLGPGRRAYSSSGVVEVGEWFLADVALHAPGGREAARARVPVLQVRRIECLPGARRCTPQAEARHVAMMGVGFAPGHGPAADATPDYNPLLNLTRGGHGRRGWIITRHGVHPGFGEAEGFRFVPLTPRPASSLPGRPDWNAVPAPIGVNGTVGQGGVLVDTGIGEAFVSPPDGVTLPRGPAPAGTRVTVGLPGGAEWVAVSGETPSPPGPESVLVVHDGVPFVNTGRRFLLGHDIAFDAEAGRYGFRPVAR